MRTSKVSFRLSELFHKTKKHTNEMRERPLSEEGTKCSTKLNFSSDQRLHSKEPSVAGCSFRHCPPALGALGGGAGADAARQIPYRLQLGGLQTCANRDELFQDGRIEAAPMTLRGVAASSTFAFSQLYDIQIQFRLVERFGF